MAQVNLHKSGLKVSSKVVPEKVEQAFSSAKDAVSEAAKRVGDTVSTQRERERGREREGERNEEEKGYKCNHLLSHLFFWFASRKNTGSLLEIYTFSGAHVHVVQTREHSVEVHPLIRVCVHFFFFSTCKNQPHR